MPEIGGKYLCKADVHLVKEETIREYLSKQDPVLEESENITESLNDLGWK